MHGWLFNRHLYHEFMKADWRISVKVYRRGRSLAIYPICARTFQARVNAGFVWASGF
jgi:hypothetical protein